MNEFDWVQSKEQKRKVLLAEQHGVEHGGKGQITKKINPNREHTHTHTLTYIYNKNSSDKMEVATGAVNVANECFWLSTDGSSVFNLITHTHTHTKAYAHRVCAFISILNK